MKLRKQNDMLWKGMVEKIFPDLLRFIFPDVDTELDLQRGVQFLEKELGELYPEPSKMSHNRIVDKLIKVYRRDGQERWMLIHLEMQGDSGANFGRRMFTYYYRILDRFNQPVTAIAIFTGRKKTNIQNKFEDSCLGTSILYKYNSISIRDYPDELLINNKNPFALVMLVAKSVLLSGGDLENKLLQQKILILRILYERGLLKDPTINAIFVFLNNYILFAKEETNLIFTQQTDLITGKKNTMGIIEQLAEMKEQEGLERGILQGKEEANRLFVENLLKEGTFSLQKIAALANVSLSFVKKIKASLRTDIGGIA